MSNTEVLTSPPSPWTVDPDTLLQLRLSHAQNLFKNEQFHAALVEAEELLAQEPGHMSALKLVAEIALTIGDATLAAEAYSELLESRPTDPDFLAGLAMAQFGLAQLTISEHLARQAIRLQPNHAHAWFCLGLSLERSGKPIPAKEAFQNANAYNAERYPIRPPLEQALLDQALQLAEARFDSVAKRFYAEVPIQWADFPLARDLQSTTPPLSPFVDALYDGQPPIGSPPWSQLPSVVNLYRRNLSWGKPDVDSLAHRIQAALMREAHHWLGLPFTQP